MSEQDKTINVSVSLSDYLILRGAAGRRGMSLRGWLRIVLSGVAKGEKGES